jgi:hypothetical protein
LRRRPIEELINTQEPAFPLIQEWVAKAVRPVEVLSPSHDRDEVLLRTQVTTRSPMGAIVYDTGGILIDWGWLRVLGSGHHRLVPITLNPRSLLIVGVYNSVMGMCLGTVLAGVGIMAYRRWRGEGA